MAMAKGGGNKKPVLGNLKPEEALDVLRRLLAAHPNLKKEAESIARSLLGEMNSEEIADEVQDAVSAFDLDDLTVTLGGTKEAMSIQVTPHGRYSRKR